MARLVQHIDINPDWPEFGVGPKGEQVRLADAEKNYSPGEELESIYFIDPASGAKEYPWRGTGYYVDDRGRPTQVAFGTLDELLKATPHAPPPEPVEGGMTGAYLASLGSSDAVLDTEHRRLFGTPAAISGAGEDPDAPAAQRRRRVVFDALSERWYG